jgi:tetratricopeptide (TPR) repeat protein
MGYRRSTGPEPRLTALAILLLLLSCLCAPQAHAAGHASAVRADPQSAPSQRLSKDWKRLRSGDFEVVGDADAKDMRQIVAALAAFRAALTEKFPALRFTSPVPNVIVLFKNDAAFKPFKPRDNERHIREDVAGYFATAADRNYIVLAAAAQGALSPLNAILHEYVHFVVSRNGVDWPFWLNEGLAEFYSTFEYDASVGRGAVGLAPMYRLDWLRRGPLLPLDQVLGRDSGVKLARSPIDAQMMYAQVWAMTHYLMLGRNSRQEDEIQRYLEAVAKGTAIKDAFEASFGTSYAGLTKELEAYVARTSLPGFYVHVSPTLANAAKAEPVTEAESLYLKADLLAQVSADADAEKSLEKLFALRPDDGAGHVLLAEIRLRQKRLADALTLVAPVAEGTESTYRASLTLGTISLELGRVDDALVAFRRANTLNAAATMGWFWRSASALLAGQPAEADEAMTRLRAVEPSARWYRARALEAFHRQRYADAISDATTYIDKAGVGQESSPYMAFLAAISYWHRNDVDKATAILARVSPATAAGSWTSHVMAFMEGRLSADALLKQADDTEERTEAHTYIGLKALFANHRDDALQHLQWVTERGTKTYTEYRIAESELTWLGVAPPVRK